MANTEVLALRGYFHSWSDFQKELTRAYNEGFVITHMTQGEGKVCAVLEREADND